MMEILFTLGGVVLFYFTLPVILLVEEIYSQRRVWRVLQGFRKGQRESFQGYRLTTPEDGAVWLQNQGESVRISLNNLRIYLLSRNREGNFQGAIRRVHRRDFVSQTDGRNLVVLGEVEKQGGGVKLLKGNPRTPLVILILTERDMEWEELLFQGLESTQIIQSRWLNRSILIGAAYSILTFTFSLQQGWPPGYIIISLICALVPLFPFMPPGLLFYFLSIYCWKNWKGWIRRISTVLNLILMLASNAWLLFVLLLRFLPMIEEVLA